MSTQPYGDQGRISDWINSLRILTLTDLCLDLIHVDLFEVQIAMSSHLFGMHDFSYEWVDLVKGAGKTAWAVDTEAIGNDPNDRSGKSYDTCGGVVAHLVRLNNAYGSGGTIPKPDRYRDFAQRCANFVGASSGIEAVIIANEALCLEWEWPDGERITMDNYVACYQLCYDAIKAVSPSMVVIPQPPASWNINGTYAGNDSGDWIQQLTDMLNKIGPGRVDAIALHAYSMGHDRNLITSDAKMDPPFNHRSKTFQTYREFMNAIPAAFRNLPVYITEANPDGWDDKNDGWIQEAYAEIDRWNQDESHQPIRCLCFYRWPNEDREKFHIRSKGGVVDDFRQALQHDYRWPNRKLSVGARLGSAVVGASMQTCVPARLRSAPSTSAQILQELSSGVRVNVTGASREGDGLKWVPVSIDGKSGFVALYSGDGTQILKI